MRRSRPYAVAEASDLQPSALAKLLDAVPWRSLARRVPIVLLLGILVAAITFVSVDDRFFVASGL